MEKKAAFMTKDLDLSRNQQAAFDAWQEGRTGDSKSESTSGWSTKENTLKLILDGESKRSIERRQADEVAERLEMMLEQAGLMMDL